MFGLPLEDWLNTLWLPFLRISAAMLAAPLFSATHAPPQVRIMLAGLVSLILVPLIPERPSISPLSLDGMLWGINEIVIGIAIGFLLQMVFEAVQFGGQLIATSMGLSFATMVDPQSGSSVPVLGQFLFILSMLIFLSMGGHLEYLKLLGESFQRWPPGTSAFGPDAAMAVLSWFSELLRGGVRIALAAMMSLLVVQIALGVISRSAPALNLFSVGFPLTLLLGYFVLLRLLPELVTTLDLLLSAVFKQFDLLMQAGGPRGG